MASSCQVTAATGSAATHHQPAAARPNRTSSQHHALHTPCIHEHSCQRCPLLRPDPAARPRLEQIRDNLLARIAEAESRRWYGEAEGLKVSLAGANAKLAEMEQITARRTHAVQLGIPSFTDTAGRTTKPADDPNQF